MIVGWPRKWVEATEDTGFRVFVALCRVVLMLSDDGEMVVHDEDNVVPTGVQ
jgi:hypothetical protein